MKRNFVLSLFLILVFILSACAPQATAIPPQPEQNTAPAPTNPPAQKVTLTVMAAASLTESFGEIATVYNENHPNVEVVYNFAGSQQLAQQLAGGAPADIFASANNKQMKVVVEDGRIDESVPKEFIKNRLVVIVPKSNPAQLSTLQDLSKAGLKLVLAAKEVPVGQYSLDFLDKAIQDPTFGASFKDDVLKNVVSYEDSVKTVLTKITLGEGDAGIVYSSDVTPAAADKVEKLDIPDTLNVIASYPIAVLKDSAHPQKAQEFVDFILSEAGQSILEKYGFIPTGAPKMGENSTGSSFSVTDALGRTVDFVKVPERVVVTGKALFMIADAIYLFPEAGKRIVGIGNPNQGASSFIPIIDPDFGNKTILESDAGPEQIAALQPDAVILKSSMAEKLGAPLEALKIPVVYIDFETPEQYQRDLATLGMLFQNEKRSIEVGQFFQERYEKINKITGSLKEEDRPRTLLLYYNDKDGTVAFNIPPMTWMQTILVQTAGGQPVWQDANPGKGWAKVSLEQIAAWDADTIFLVSYFKNPDEVVKELKADPQWKNLRAIQQEKLYAFPGDIYSWDQPDPRWILGLTWLAGTLHPDQYPGLDMVKESAAFFQTLYGIDQATFDKNILPAMKGDLP